MLCRRACAIAHTTAGAQTTFPKRCSSDAADHTNAARQRNLTTRNREDERHRVPVNEHPLAPDDIAAQSDGHAGELAGLTTKLGLQHREQVGDRRAGRQPHAAPARPQTSTEAHLDGHVGSLRVQAASVPAAQTGDARGIRM